MTDELRESLEEAVDAHDDDNNAEATPNAEIELDQSGEGTPNATPSPTGEEESPAPEGDPSLGAGEDKPTPDAAEPAPDDSGKPTDTPAAVADDKPLKAPIDYSPAAREQWSKVPHPVKKQILAREASMATAMQETSGNKRFVEAAQSAVAGHSGIMQAEGLRNPIEATSAYLETVSTLRNGTAHERAATVADIITKYGVDIGTLDQLLVSGGVPAQGQPVPAGTPMQDPRLDQLLRQMEAQNSQQEQQRTRQAGQDVQKFAETAEFLGDVRHQMADLIDVAAKNGRDMPLQEAYETACQLNPEIRGVLSTRAESERLKSASAVLGGKKAAAASLNGRKSGLSGNNENNSLHDTISEMWDNQSRA